MKTARYITAAVAAISLISASQAADMAGRTLITDIAPYVYPDNRPSAPSSMIFMPDGQSYLAANPEHTVINQYDTRSGSLIGQVFDASSSREAKIASFESFEVSADGKQLLICTDSQSIYRRSVKAAYYVYEIRHNILRPLSTEHPLQQSPVISPDGRAVAFVADNNIYIKKLDYNTEVAVTTDGAINKIIYGVPDWTYEEEFQTTCSMAWAPDSETLAFLRYDESRVPMYSIPLYQGTCDPLNQYALYPGTMTYKYPVAGEPNSYVTLHSYDLSTRKVKDIPFADPNIEYIPRIAYGPDASTLLAVTLNRDQNRMEIYSVNPKSTTVKSLLVEESDSWIDPMSYEEITLTPKSFIIHSSRTGFNHLYEYSYTGSLMHQITSGDFDVTACYGVDSAGTVWFQSAMSSPLNRVVSRIDARGKVSDLTDADATASATFAPGMAYMILKQSTATTPPSYALYNSTGRSVRSLVDNNAYLSALGRLPVKEFFTVPSDGVELNAYIIKPLDFDPSHRYPVIMWQYSGPGSQQVLNSWALDWDYYAALEGFVVVCVDGRGTGCRGRKFENIVYRNLGYYETIDQINAAKYVAQLPFVDRSRIGIAGWSYGGYETLMAVSQSNSPYAAAVAIAPVTDWRYYDTVYAERYMLTPRANEDGYRQSAPINRTNLVNCRLLIMYGTADDNVHPANTIEYVSHLQSGGAFCDMLLFPNMNHSIRDCNARTVVYAKMIDYFKQNL